ncbi:MAG TPA: hypothetical protein VF542_10430 [Jatrophihabitans sp.]
MEASKYEQRFCYSNYSPHSIPLKRDARVHGPAKLHLQEDYADFELIARPSNYNPGEIAEYPVLATLETTGDGQVVTEVFLAPAPGVKIAFPPKVTLTGTANVERLDVCCS